MNADADFMQRSLVEARIEQLHAHGRRAERSSQGNTQSWNAIARLLGQIRATR